MDRMEAYSTKWVYYKAKSGEIHSIPTGDILPHELGRYCECCPKIDGFEVIHSHFWEKVWDGVI